MSIHINRKWMIECQHSFDGKALFTVWLLMIVLGAPAVPTTSNAIIDKVEEALKNGIVGNEDDDW